ncbi:hypothetical protein DBO85_00160 [Pseudomonas mangrovi]|uniref:Uncharacterized protein n=1 Tax=Pseudomonas mangrovi TaxID=2161748 RepID=A0A2T5PEC4_9PSED|nr:hypothetical protein DBO85_00160 [Pseudomonas mangrovi]
MLQDLLEARHVGLCGRQCIFGYWLCVRPSQRFRLLFLDAQGAAQYLVVARLPWIGIRAAVN